MNRKQMREVVDIVLELNEVEPDDETWSDSDIDYLIKNMPTKWREITDDPETWPLPASFDYWIWAIGKDNPQGVVKITASNVYFHPNEYLCWQPAKVAKPAPPKS